MRMDVILRGAIGGLFDGETKKGDVRGDEEVDIAADVEYRVDLEDHAHRVRREILRVAARQPD